MRVFSVSPASLSVFAFVSLLCSVHPPFPVLLCLIVAVTQHTTANTTMDTSKNTSAK